MPKRFPSQSLEPTDRAVSARPHAFRRKSRRALDVAIKQPLTRHDQLVLALAFFSSCLPIQISAQESGVPGVDAGRVVFGQSAGLTGPAGELGQGMRLGIQAAFAEANAQGGVHGRQLELQSLDDAYEPEAAVINTRRLIEQEQVFALIGAVGTPTSRAAIPIATSAGVPYVAAFTGAELLRTGAPPNVINLRASYYQETEELVASLVEDLGIKRIGIMYQEDSFGRAGYQGVSQALLRRGLEPQVVSVYRRNTTAVKTGLLDLIAAHPDAVILVGAYQPIAALIAWAKKLDFDPLMLTISFVGSNALLEALGAEARGTVVSQVVPFPAGDEPRVVEEYRHALSRLSPESNPGFVSLEGYLAGRMALRALERVGRQLDRQAFIDSLILGEDFDLSGFELKFSDGDNQGSDKVFLTVIDASGVYRPISSLRDTAR